MTTYEHLVIERHGPVGWLINDRPDQLNAMNGAMRYEFAGAWRELDDDPAVRVIVHTGNGRAFQTGADIAVIGFPLIQSDNIEGVLREFVERGKAAYRPR